MSRRYAGLRRRRTIINRNINPNPRTPAPNAPMPVSGVFSLLDLGVAVGWLVAVDSAVGVVPASATSLAASVAVEAGVAVGTFVGTDVEVAVGMGVFVAVGGTAAVAVSAAAIAIAVLVAMVTSF